MELLALLLLSGVPNTYDPNPPDFATLAPIVQRVAITLEILDPREVTYILAKPEGWECDLNLLRCRFHDLKDAPRLADSERFPDRHILSAALSFNRELRSHWCDRAKLEIDRADILGEAVAECDSLYRVLDAARDGRADYYYTCVRRFALKRLRDDLGPEDWATGTLPMCVPTWRFVER